MSESEILYYKRATFVTRLPTSYRYSPAHCWLAQQGNLVGETWRVGYTKFALRMLGELVDVQLESQTDDVLAPGDVLGSIEGFKAISDVYSAGTGRFLRGNPALNGDLAVLSKDPYGNGWLYEFSGQPDVRSLGVYEYRDLLDETIDRILARQKEEAGNDA